MARLATISWLLVLLAAGSHASKSKKQHRSAPAEEKEGSYWLAHGRRHIEGRLSRVRPVTGRARNVILFLGDGMSVTTVTAARVLRGQLDNRTGEEASLSFDAFPWTGLSKTYCVNSQVADSACSATAYLGGVKGNIQTLGVTAAVRKGDCAAAARDAHRVPSALHWAQRARKATGIVTTTRVTHASPAGAFAYSADRDWESDADLPAAVDPAVCPDIARQLVTGSPGRDINVILGGGRRAFLPAGVKDEEGRAGARRDGEDLIKTWAEDKRTKNATHRYVWDKDGLLKVPEDTEYLLGLFSSSHMPYSLHADTDRRPSLAQMVRSAITVLRNNPNGYFLFVEGGRIDHAHHDTEARRALHETLEFSEAVAEAARAESEDDTLIVVTADHAHTMTMSGYPERGNDILGLAGHSDVDKLPYATLSYANGPANHDRHDLAEDDMESDSYKYPSAVPEHIETHGGDDVAVFARGPWAHLLSGVMEQSVIAAAMGFAACMGPFAADSCAAHQLPNAISNAPARP